MAPLLGAFFAVLFAVCFMYLGAWALLVILGPPVLFVLISIFLAIRDEA